MSDLTIYGFILSQPLRSVISFCRLSNIPFTYVHLNILARENMTEDYAKINPTQTVPAIVHNGYSLWESHAIVTYLADAFDADNQWYPKDIKIRGKINAYLHWHNEGTRGRLSGYLRPKIIGPTYYGWPKMNEETEARLRAAAEEWFEIFTWQLTETHYAARTQGPTIADIFAYNELVNISRIFEIFAENQRVNVSRFVDIARFPEVKAWFDEIGAIPVVQQLTEEFLEAATKIFNS
jgi:glutathione S-transferase